MGKNQASQIAWVSVLVSLLFMYFLLFYITSVPIDFDITLISDQERIYTTICICFVWVILIRYLLTRNRAPNLGAVVGTNHNGSEIEGNGKKFLTTEE